MKLIHDLIRTVTPTQWQLSYWYLELWYNQWKVKVSNSNSNSNSNSSNKGISDFLIREKSNLTPGRAHHTESWLSKPRQFISRIFGMLWRPGNLSCLVLERKRKKSKERRKKSCCFASLVNVWLWPNWRWRKKGLLSLSLSLSLYDPNEIDYFRFP